MRNLVSAKAILFCLIAFGLFCAGFAVAANKYGAPSTILHVVTVKWKDDSTPEQRHAALDGVRKMAAEIPGIRNVWIKSIRVQPREFHASFAIEFEDKAAADRYVDHPAHRDWLKIYSPIHEESYSQQITN